MSNKRSILLFVAIGMLVTMAVAPFVVHSARTFHTFEMKMPEEVNVMPGENVTVEGDIYVTGYFWLHNFNLSVSGLPYDYELDPEWWEHVRIVREWSSEKGVYRTPEKFELYIDVPADASGSYIVTVTGEEHHSFRQVSNFTYFVLRVAGEPLKPQLTVSDILVPEEITEYEPFKLTFKVNNEGPLDTVATISVVIPADWEVDEPTQNISVKKNESSASSFTIIPTTNAGEVSLMVEYPFKEEIIKFTKTGPYLIPTGAITTTTTVPEEKPESLLSQIIGYASSLVEKITERFESVGGPYTASIIMGIIFVLFIIIVWLVLDIVRFTRTERKEPEEIEEKEKPKASKTKAKAAEPEVAEAVSELESAGVDTVSTSGSLANEFDVRVKEI